MPNFLYKRIVHRAEYYCVKASNSTEGYKKLESKLDTLADGLMMYQDETFPTEKEEPFEDNEQVELVAYCH